MTAPLKPASAWFERPDVAPHRRLVVEPTGQVFGRWYVAGLPIISGDGVERVIRPSPSQYNRLFHTRSVVTAEGDTIACGVVTFGHGRAADPGAVVAVVRVGDDVAGGWVAGSLVSEASETDAADLRRSALSGEWCDMGDERGFELFGLAAVAVGATVLERVVTWGVSPALRRDELQRLRDQEQAFRAELRRVVDENPPNIAVAAIRRVLDRADNDSVRRRVDALEPVALPEGHVPPPPQPVISSKE